jgi:hypothetical protein
MLFQSRFSMYSHIVRGKIEFFHPVTGVKTNEVKELVCYFGEAGAEFDYPNPMTGGTDTGVEIRGHFFDTDAVAQQMGWDKEEKQSVEDSLLMQAQRTPQWVWKVEHPEQEVRIEKPWATYDKTKSELIAEYAAELECVEQALAYEQASKGRKAVMAALEEKLADVAQTQELTAVE